MSLCSQTESHTKASLTVSSVHAPDGVCSLCRDLLVSDSPPSAWLLIAQRRQETRRSGTDIADQNCKHAEGVYL